MGRSDNHTETVRSRRALLLLPIASLLLGLVPAAYAAEPDPTWIAGYWDGGDFDDAGLFIVGACAIEVVRGTDVAPRWMPVAVSDPRASDARPVAPRVTASPRAPPRLAARLLRPD